MPDPLSPVGLIIRALLFGGILAAVGAAAFRFIILNPLARRSEAAAAIGLSLAARAAKIGAVAALLVVIMAFARLRLQLHDLREPPLPVQVDIRALLVNTIWGRAWIAQLVLAATAMLAYARPRSRSSWHLAALASTALAFTPAFSGHAFGRESWPWIAALVDGLHTLGAGAWIGAMIVLAALLTLPRREGRGDLAMVLVAAFSPLALGAAATVAVSGGISGLMHVGSLEALVSSRYGRTLMIKVGMVLAVVAVGAFNWKRAGPRAKQQADERPMLRSIKAELVVAALVLLATAALVVTPPPGEE